VSVSLLWLGQSLFIYLDKDTVDMVKLGN